jgi:hypothetical protein
MQLVVYVVKDAFVIVFVLVRGEVLLLSSTSVKTSSL